MAQSSESPPPNLRLGLNIDHVATLRNARGVGYPDIMRAVQAGRRGGAVSITAHLREDRRHIQDADIDRLAAELDCPLNFEIAATNEMLAIAARIKPHACCLVPEKREEVTTEGGLNIRVLGEKLTPKIKMLSDLGSRVSLFIEPDLDDIRLAKTLGAGAVELHTGLYCNLVLESDQAGAKAELARIVAAAQLGHSLGLEVHAGHGITYDTVQPIARIPEIAELNIGHFLVSEAVFVGLEAASAKMLRLMNEARA